MSQAYPRATPPAASISFAVSSAPSSFRSTIATLQPSAARRSASALPRLRAPPVTSATRSRMPRSTLLPLELRLALAEERLDAFRRRPRCEAPSGTRASRSASAWSIGASSPSSTASMMSRVAMGGRLAICRASAFASSRVWPSFDIRFTRPSARHSAAGICVPRIMNSSAFVRPMRRGIRWRAAEPRDDAEVRLRLAHPRAVLEEAEVTGHRDLAAAPERVPVHRGDDGLRETARSCAGPRCRSA